MTRHNALEWMKQNPMLEVVTELGLVYRFNRNKNCYEVREEHRNEWWRSIGIDSEEFTEVCK